MVVDLWRPVLLISSTHFMSVYCAMELVENRSIIVVFSNEDKLQIVSHKFIIKSPKFCLEFRPNICTAPHVTSRLIDIKFHPLRDFIPSPVLILTVSSQEPREVFKKSVPPQG